MKKLARYLLLLAAMGLGFAFASCKADDDDDTSQPPVYYTVSFNSNGGTEVKSQKVESGKKATKPTNPTKQAIATETYAFDDWYTSTDNGTTFSDTAFDFNTPITKDITLYAKWATNVVTHTVTFDSKNGSTAEIKTVNHGNKVERPTNPTKAATEAETYTFENWYTSTDGGATLSDTAFDFNTPITKDITLYAKWATNVVTHTVTFDSKNGSTAEIKTVNHGNKVERPTNPTKAATEAETYAFDNWYTSTDGGETLSETAFDFDTAIEGDITLYAKWTATAIHTVTFNTNGGSDVASQTIVHGIKATKPADPTKTATAAETYTFDNWYTSTDGGTTLSESAFDFDTAIKGDITLYAKWTVNAITHTVTFDTKGGNSSPAEQTIDHGKKATKPETDPTKTETKTEAFVFAGWYTSTDGGTTLSETAFDFDTAITDNITLYAKWNVYTIEYIELKDCSVIRTMFETLCDYSSSYPYKFNKTITRFAKAEARPASAENYIDAAENQIPLWYDEGKTTLYYYLEPGKKMTLRTSDAQNSLFECMSDAVYIETGDFDTSNVTDMRCMFSGCKALTSLDASKFDTSKVTYMRGMFYECKALTSLDVSKFDTSNVTDMGAMFSSCNALTSLDVSKFDTSNVTNMSFMFYECKALTSLDVSKFGTSNVTDMDFMFYNCKALTSLDVSKFDTSNVTDMGYMFYECKALTSLDVSKFDTSKVTNMGYMFSGCNALTSLDVSKFDTSNVTNMGKMFSSCNALTSLDVSKFGTSNVTDMDFMFYNCKALTSLDVSKFDTSNVTTMRWMFSTCSSLTSLDVSNFDTSKVTDMGSMFSECKALTSLDVSKFDTSNVTNMEWMFRYCSNLTTIFASDKFVTNGVTSDYNMFSSSSKLQGGAGTVYDENHINKEYARIDGGTENPGYFTAKTN